MTEKSGALLPVISANIEGLDGLYKHGNVLFDQFNTPWNRWKIGVEGKKTSQ